MQTHLEPDRSIGVRVIMGGTYFHRIGIVLKDEEYDEHTWLAVWASSQAITDQSDQRLVLARSLYKSAALHGFGVCSIYVVAIPYCPAPILAAIRRIHATAPHPDEIRTADWIP